MNIFILTMSVMKRYVHLHIHKNKVLQNFLDDFDFLLGSSRKRDTQLGTERFS